MGASCGLARSRQADISANDSFAPEAVISIKIDHQQVENLALAAELSSYPCADIKLDSTPLVGSRKTHSSFK
jgi:hypothetical protein